MDKKTLRELMEEICPMGIIGFKKLLEDNELSTPAKLYFLSVYHQLDEKTKITKIEKSINKLKTKLSPVNKKIRIWIKRRKIAINYLKRVYGKHRYGKK